MKKVFICFVLIMCFSFVINKENMVKASVNFSSNCIAMDYDTNRIIYENNKDRVMLPASITKILTCIVAIENGNLDDYYKVDYKTISQTGSSIYMDLNDEMKLYDLLCGLMMRSGNDCAYLIASNVFNDYDLFIDKMNEYALKIGMESSVFNNPSGLDSKDIKECNYTTCYDMALLMKYAYSNKVFREINEKVSHRCESKNGKIYVFNTKHKLIKNYDYCVAGKTGYTSLASRTLVSVFEKDDLCLIVVTMDCGNDWEVHLNLADYYFDNFERCVFMKSGLIDVNDSKYPYTPIIYEDIAYPLRDEESLNIKVYLYTESNDDKIGYVKIYLNSNNENIFIKNIIIYRYC